MKRLVPVALTAMLLSGCLVMVPGQLYPVQGPLSLESPAPIYKFTLSGVYKSGTLSATLPDGEVCKGDWSAIARDDPSAKQFSAQWDAVYGTGFFVANVLGNPVFAGAILIGLAAWAYQKSKGSSAGGRITALITAAIAVLLAIMLPVQFSSVSAAPLNAPAVGARDADSWQPYDAAHLEEFKDAGRPVLVNFTASWCLTCLVNERNAFADSAVQQVFHVKGVTLMKGDWTNRDPAITKALAAFGRAGVPLYVVYNSKPGSAEPVVLPQILSAGVVRGAFAELPDRDSQ